MSDSEDTSLCLILKAFTNQINLSYFKLLWWALYSMIVFCGRFNTLFSVSLNQKGRIILFSTQAYMKHDATCKKKLQFGSGRILTPESSKKFRASGENWTHNNPISNHWAAGGAMESTVDMYYSYTSHHNIFFCTLGMNIILVYLSLLLHESWHDTCKYVQNNTI